VVWEEGGLGHVACYALFFEEVFNCGRPCGFQKGSGGSAKAFCAAGLAAVICFLCKALYFLP
jgi:hypothetical protein